jgi:hypothetical protein
VTSPMSAFATELAATDDRPRSAQVDLALGDCSARAAAPQTPVAVVYQIRAFPSLARLESLHGWS